MKNYETLKTWEFGTIRIVTECPDVRFDSFIRCDIIGEWEYWQLLSGEIVAYPIPQE